MLTENNCNTRLLLLLLLMHFLDLPSAKVSYETRVFANTTTRICDALPPSSSSSSSPPLLLIISYIILLHANPGDSRDYNEVRRW